MKTLSLSSIFLAVLALMLTFARPAEALNPDGNGWYNTGSGVRTKTVAIITAKVYAIRHDMKQLPPSKSKQAVIDIDCDKRFSWRMLRDVDGSKIQNALREAFQMNGYGDGGKIGQFVGAFSNELKENQSVSISYSSANKTVTVWVQGGGSATVAGADFMKAVWSIWFGKIDQPSLGDSLISNM